MHNIGSYVSSNAVFDVLDYSKMFRGILCTSGWLGHGKRHKWTDLPKCHPSFLLGVRTNKLKIHVECCERLDSTNCGSHTFVRKSWPCPPLLFWKAKQESTHFCLWTVDTYEHPSSSLLICDYGGFLLPGAASLEVINLKNDVLDKGILLT